MGTGSGGTLSDLPTFEQRHAGAEFWKDDFEKPLPVLWILLQNLASHQGPQTPAERASAGCPWALGLYESPAALARMDVLLSTAKTPVPLSLAGLDALGGGPEPRWDRMGRIHSRLG